MMIQVRALTKTLVSASHRVEILRGIDLMVPKGEVLAIQGPSGSGKSTLLGLLAGFDSPTSGTIHLDGVDITEMGEDELALLRGKKLGFVFQSYHLIPTLTAEENVMLPIELQGNSRKAEEKARELLEAVGLQERFGHYPAQLSGGEQQRVALARAFAGSPSILLADEPTGNLDTLNGNMVLELLLKLNRQIGTTLLLVTHDPMLSRRADRIIHLRDGRIEEESFPSRTTNPSSEKSSHVL